MIITSEINEENVFSDGQEEQIPLSFGEDTQELISEKADLEPLPEDDTEQFEEFTPCKYAAEIFDWLEVLVTAMVAVVLIFSFVFRVATIDGESMQPTLFEPEKVIITNMAYKPTCGDIVVISRNKENSVDNNSDMPIIKRIIATEGQTVDIDFEKGEVYVDGVKENYVNVPTTLYYDIKFPVTVDEGCVFVLGDNRNNSLDSRSSSIGNNGMIDTRYILGHAVIRIFPFNKIGGID